MKEIKMFQGKIKKENRTLLLELLKLMAETDGYVSEEESMLILKMKKQFHLKNYEYDNLTKEEIYSKLSQLEEEEVLNILTYSLLMALEDKVMNENERILFQEFFSLLSLESAAKLQKFIDEYGQGSVDIKEFYANKFVEEETLSESIEMMNEFSGGKEEDIDEAKLMKMNKGPLKKVWAQVLSLYNMVRSPKSDKAVKAIAIGALLYVIFPFDVISDVIPILGLTDDVAVVTYAISQIAKRTSAIKSK